MVVATFLLKFDILFKIIRFFSVFVHTRFLGALLTTQFALNKKEEKNSLLAIRWQKSH